MYKKSKKISPLKELKLSQLKTSSKTTKTPKRGSTASVRARPTVAKLKKKADAAWSIYVRHRDAEFKRGEWYCVCVTCDVERPVREMQCGHLVSRRVNALRFHPRNTHPQCYSCNVARHGEQFLYAQYVDKRYGAGTAEELFSQRFSTHKFTIGELDEIIADAKQKAAEIQARSA